MEHYVVILDWATSNEENVDILGVFHTFEEAEELFNTHVEYEREVAKERDYKVSEDFKGCFVAYADGDFIEEHTKLYIQGV